MDVYITVNHKLSEVDRKLLKDLFENFVQDEFSQFEANDPFIQNLIVQIDSLFIPFKVIIYLRNVFFFNFIKQINQNRDEICTHIQTEDNLPSNSVLSI